MACPRIAASGNTVIVSWLANATGAVRARVSTDAGQDVERDRGDRRDRHRYPGRRRLGIPSGRRLDRRYERHRSHLGRRCLVRSEGDDRAGGCDLYRHLRPGHRPQRDDRRRRGVDRLRHGMHVMDIGHPGQPCLERIEGRWCFVVRRSGHRVLGLVIGTPVQRLPVRPLAVGHATARHLECRDRRDELLSDRDADRPRRRRCDDVQRGPDDAAVRRARQRGTAANTASVDGRFLTDRRPAGIESACRPAGAFIRGPGVTAREPGSRVVRR